MFCRICLEEGGDLLNPCRCSGTMKYVHHDCIQQWLSQNIHVNRCEICHHTFTFSNRKTLLQKIITKIAQNSLIEVYVVIHYLIMYVGSLLFNIAGLPYCEDDPDCYLRISYIAYSLPQYLFQTAEIVQRCNGSVRMWFVITIIYGNTLYLTLGLQTVPMWITIIICLILTRFSLEISYMTIPKPRLRNYNSFDPV